VADSNDGAVLIALTFWDEVSGCSLTFNCFLRRIKEALWHGGRSLPEREEQEYGRCRGTGITEPGCLWYLTMPVALLGLNHTSSELRESAFDPSSRGGGTNEGC
jgi:hypothetical protein